MPVIDISGKRFGSLVVIGRYGYDSTKKVTWECQCDCGRISVATGLNLKAGNTTSCGCKKNPSKAHDLTGKRFGRLVVLYRVERDKGKAFWLCACDCGQTTVVWSGHLSNGHTQSCSCVRQETSVEIAKRHLSGKKAQEHPRWRDDLSPEERQRRRDTQHKEWSACVLKRDRYRCAGCKSKGKLHAHHLNGYKEHLDQRYDPYNGVCLCESCHTELHKAKGYTGIRREDFYSYFEFPNPDEGIEDWAKVPFPTDLNLIKVLDALCRAVQSEDPLQELYEAAMYLADEIALRKGEVK